MLRYGKWPWLEASTKGDKRFSAFFARIRKRGNESIEDIYQAAKVFEDGRTGLGWKAAKGKKAVNQKEVEALYETLWREYLDENPSLKQVIRSARGIQDTFGQKGHACQATVLWKIRGELLAEDDFGAVETEVVETDDPTIIDQSLGAERD